MKVISTTLGEESYLKFKSQTAKQKTNQIHLTKLKLRTAYQRCHMENEKTFYKLEEHICNLSHLVHQSWYSTMNWYIFVW